MPDPYDETDLKRRSRVDRRDEVIGLSGLTALAGLWLLASPVLLGYSSDDPALLDAVTGVLIMSFALIRVGGAFRSTWPSLVNIALGLWVFLGIPLADTAAAAMNHLFVGAFVVLFASSSAFSTLLAMQSAQRDHERSRSRT